MNNIISLYGYGIEKLNNENIINELKEELTVIPKNFNTPDKIKFAIYSENNKRVYIPRYYGLQKFGIPSINKLNEGEDCPSLIFNGELREQQKEPVNNFIEAAKNPLKMGGIISVPCGFGKTIMAVYIACYFKKKTMFVSHKDFLNQQFLDSVKQFVPNAKIGKIKQSKVDVENKDFVIASLQSLAMREYDINIFKNFGLVIIDEVHHTGAEVFSKAFKYMNVPMILGLSATLNRKDGLRRVFENYIGKSVYKHIDNEKIEVNVELHKYFDTNIDYCNNLLLWNGKPNSAAMINNICNYEKRTLFIYNLVLNILKNENNRKILILSERRNQLKYFEQLFDNTDYSIGYYIGGLSQDVLNISSKKQIILATYQMAAEGMNIPTLNTVIFASPISDIQQAIGRILREKPSERTYIPLCIDIWDQFSLFIVKGFTRIKYYKKNNYTLKYFSDNQEIIYQDKNEETNKKLEFIEDC
ncbi:DEAD/DEAH box helicase family protein [bacterium]|nr:DEAD/DEAH box helicase family protein [bacterium]|tara:strand:- start:4451 stop:5866 length:1416 start_codon:yes stop_codon:yes gene_type:complete